MSNQEYKHPIPSRLKSDIKTTGDLHTKGTLIINGEIKVDIVGDIIEISSTTSLVGEIQARGIILNGSLRGAVCTGKISIGSTAAFDVELQYKHVDIEKGAKINVNFIEVFNQKETRSLQSPRILPTLAL